MSPTALALISASVLLHVLWNTVAKGRPTVAFLFVGNLIGATTLSPVLFAHTSVVVDLPILVWIVLGCTGVVQTIYGLSLMRAYREEDLSVVYPLVRSLGPAFVVMGSLALGRGDAIGLACVLGVVAILIGSAALGLGNLRALGKSTLKGAGLRFSVLAALGTMAYTLLDDVGVRGVLASGSFESIDNSQLQSGLLYASLQALATCLVTGLWLMRTREHRQEIRAYTSRKALRDAAIMGIGSIASYALVLIAMLYVSDVSYVAGFRQLSVPLGAAVGVFWLGERLDRMRALGLLAMLVGLLAIAWP